MNIVINFEEVADYFESMTEKLLEMNDKIIGQAREMQATKSALNSKNQAMEDKVNILEGDVARLTGELRDSKALNSRRYQELSEKTAFINNDSFGEGEALKQRLELLDSKITKVVNQMNTTKIITSQATNSAPQINQNGNRDSQNQTQNQNQNRNQKR
jgi:hypothetical protein